MSDRPTHSAPARAAHPPSRSRDLITRGEPGMQSGVARASRVVPIRREESAPVRVVVADDHPVVRAGLRALFATADGLAVVAESATGRDAVREALLHRPDVLVTDLRPACPDSLAVIRDVVRSVAGVGVLVFTMVDDDRSLAAAIRAGARGYVIKSAPQEDVLRAIRGVAAGGAVFGSRIADRLADLVSGSAGRPPVPFPELTAREREVLDLIAAGASNSAIARHLQLAPKTVGNHVSAIFAKLQVTGRAEVIVRARDAGLGDLTRAVPLVAGRPRDTREGFPGLQGQAPCPVGAHPPEPFRDPGSPQSPERR
jgi:DNA-binding NarL/FixJ family response regulator